jgi:hypothetical protein
MNTNASGQPEQVVMGESERNDNSSPSSTSNIDGNDDDEGTSIHAGDNDINDNDDDAFDNVLDNDDDEDDEEDEYNYDNAQTNMDVDYNVEDSVNASSEERKQRCIKMTEAFFAHYPPKVMKAAMDFIDSIGDNGIVIWMQALCAYFDMSIESGRESSIPEDFDTNKSPSVKFTFDVLDPMSKVLNPVTFRCNMRCDCERNGSNCLNARASEASRIAPLIVCIAKYAHSRGNEFKILNLGGKSIERQLFPKVRQLSNGEVSFVNEDGNHFKHFHQYNKGWFPSREVQTFVMTRQLVGIASGLGVARDIAMNLASSLNFISSDYLDLDAPVRKQFEDAYNAYHQKATQELVERMARGRIEKALIGKFKETPDQCSLVEIEKANALIAKRANRKRKRTDGMLETVEQKVEKRRKAEATRLEAEERKAANKRKAEATRLENEERAFNRAERDKEQAAKLASYKLDAENTLAKLASYKRAEEKERVAAAKEAAKQLAAMTNCTVDSKWEVMFAVLVRHIKETRETATMHMNDEQKAAWIWDGNVPFSYKTPCGKALGGWINTQRTAKAKEKLKDERELRLTSICLRWKMSRGKRAG